MAGRTCTSRPRSAQQAERGSIVGQVTVTQDRRAEVDQVLVTASRWASSNRDISGLGIAGSWARGAERMSSDVDLVVLTASPDSYIQSEEWLSDFGDPPVVRTQEWGGVLTERRVRMNSGLEIEFGFTTPVWAAVAPVDAGTRRVVSDGMRPLYDPVGSLMKLIAEVRGES
jgi:predicted nucleotidyltransferase